MEYRDDPGRVSIVGLVEDVLLLQLVQDVLPECCELGRGTVPRPWPRNLNDLLYRGGTLGEYDDPVREINMIV